ncbi:MAG: hypothetical protein NWF03_04730 [Candidatus Bathyarchaeota archaeon]|nr:hypothetical protein [Candidatus Bathyarchaeota archaeon]
MARRRRPSILLIVIFIILLLLYFFAGALVTLVSSFSGNGYFHFSYTEGSEAIVSIRYSLPQELADAIDPKNVPGWTVTLANNVLSLTGGSLSPGESVTVDYTLTKYIAGGIRTIPTTATTATGNQLTQQLPLEVQDAFLLGLMYALYQNSIWLLILALIVLAVIIVLFFIGKKKDDEEKKAE